MTEATEARRVDLESPGSLRWWIGWVCVVLCTSLASFWAFWGAMEAFHEGWCMPLLWQRLLQTLAYLTPAALIALITASAIRWPVLGVVAGLSIVAFLLTAQALGYSRFPWLLLLLLAGAPGMAATALYFGRPTPRGLSIALAISAPLAVAILSGIGPAIRVAGRFDDGDRSMQLIAGNGVELEWAPAGPGWARKGNVNYTQTIDRVTRLSYDGQTLMNEPQDVWRLPTREEVVRSLTCYGENAGGQWDTTTADATYGRTPDKESPLWDPHAPLIYLWTADELDDRRAWIVVYHGGVFAKDKQLGSASIGFRAVRDPRPQQR